MVYIPYYRIYFFYCGVYSLLWYIFLIMVYIPYYGTKCLIMVYIPYYGVYSLLWYIFLSMVGFSCSFSPRRPARQEIGVWSLGV